MQRNRAADRAASVLIILSGVMALFWVVQYMAAFAQTAPDTAAPPLVANRSAGVQALLWCLPLAACVCALVYLFTPGKKHPVRSALFPVALGLQAVSELYKNWQLWSGVTAYTYGFVEILCAVLGLVGCVGTILALVGAVADFRCRICWRIGTLLALVSYVAVAVVTVVNAGSAAVGTGSFYASRYVWNICLTAWLIYGSGILFYGGLSLFAPRKTEPLPVER